MVMKKKSVKTGRKTGYRQSDYPKCPRGMMWDPKARGGAGGCISIVARKPRKKPYNSNGGGMDMYG
jgi:hypothetical protein